MAEKAMKALEGFAGKVKATNAEMAASAEESAGKQEAAHNKISGGMMAAGVAGLGMAAAVVEIGKKSMEAAGQYQQATAAFGAKSGESAGRAKAMGDAFLKAFGSTTFGAQASLAALAPVSGELGQMTGHALTTKEGLEVMKAAMADAEASGGNLTSTTKTLTDVMRVFHTPLADASSAADDLFNTSTRLGVPIEQLGSVLARVTPRLLESGMTLQQESGFMLEMSQAAGGGRAAMGMMATATQALADPVSSGAKALQGLGISLFDANGKFIGMGPAIDKLHEAFAKMPQATDAMAAGQQLTADKALLAHLALEKQTPAVKAQEQAIKDHDLALQAQAKSLGSNAEMQKIFGASAGAMAQIIAGGSGAFDQATEAAGKEGSAEQAAAKMASTNEAAHEKLKNTVKAAEISLGEGLLPTMTRFLTAVTKVLQPVMQWIASHQQLTIIILAVVGGVGLLVAAIAGLSAVLGVFDIALGTTGALLAGGIMLGIIALAAAAFLVYKNWDTIAKFFENIWKDIKKWFDEGVKWVVEHWKFLAEVLAIALLGPLGLVIAAVIKWWSDIKRWFEDGIRDITGAWHTCWDALSDAWRAFSGAMVTAWNDFVDAARTVWHAITDAVLTVWRPLWDVVMDVWHVVYHLIHAEWTFFSTIARIAFTLVKDAVLLVWQLTWDAVKLIWTALRDLLKAEWAAFVAVAKALWDAIRGPIEAVWKALDQVIRTVWNALREFLKAEWAAFVTVATTLWNAIKGAVEAVWRALDAVFRAVWNALRDFLRTEWQIFSTIASTLWNAIKGAVEAVWRALDQTFRNVWGALRDFLKNEWNTFKDAASTAWHGIVNGITAAWDGLTNGAERAWRDIKSFFVNGANDVINVLNDFIGLLDKIPGVHLDKIAPISGGSKSGPVATANPPGLASGGLVTNQPTVLVGEGGPYPEWVIPSDPAHHGNAMRLLGDLLPALGIRAMATGGEIVSSAANYFGMPYLWGGGHGANFPDAMAKRIGVDCSGLVNVALKRDFGNTGTQVGMGHAVSSLDQSVPGDLVFFGSLAEGEPHHVGIVVGPGAMLNAPHTGANVEFDAISAFGPIDGIRRVATGSSSGGIFGLVGEVLGAVGSAVSVITSAMLSGPKALAMSAAGLLPAPFSGVAKNVVESIVNFLTSSGGGGAPVGPVGNVGDVASWAGQMLVALGDPVSQANVASLVRWAGFEGGHWHNTATFNPLNTTQAAPGSHSMNSVGVQAYTSWQQGVQATVDTLRNGRYGTVLAELASGGGLTSAADGNLSTWGTGAIFDRGGVLAPGWNGPIFNGTGRPEPLVPAGSAGVTVDFHPTYDITVSQPMTADDLRRLMAEHDDELIRTIRALG